MCSDHRLAHPDETVAKSIATHALRGHACALQQQEQFVREHFRLRQFGGGAEVNNPLALCGLERFNYAPRRMILFRAGPRLQSGIAENAPRWPDLTSTVGCRGSISAVEPLAMCYLCLIGSHFEGRLTPQIQNISGLPQGLAGHPAIG